MTDDVEQLLSCLLAAGVDFVLIGGVAAAVHGSEQLTNSTSSSRSQSRT